MPTTTLFTRRIAALVLLLSLLVAGGTMAAFSDATPPPRGSGAPVASESARADALAARLPGHDVQTLVLVATRADGGPLTPTELSQLTTLGREVGAGTGHGASPAIGSKDGKAATVMVPVEVSGGSSQASSVVKSVRAAVAADAPAGVDVQVTGGPAFGVDIASAFDGADLRLLLVTVGIVALLLLLTYRSPILWLAPLTVVGIADQVAAKVTAALGTAWSLEFDSGIVSVLVFGAGTNYALLLVSRYREELHRHPDHRTAMRIAWRESLPAIVASNLTVVLALLTLTFAVIPGTRGLGVTSAVGLLIALVAVLVALPAVLVLCGRGIFWPFVPRFDESSPTALRTNLFGRVARGVVRRPATVLGVALAGLALMVTGLVGTSVGLSQTEKFRVPSESAAGLETLAAHFPAGEAAPLQVLTPTASATEVASALRSTPGVASVRPGAAGEVDGRSWTTISVTGTPAPGTAAGRALVADARTAAHAASSGQALVGGSQATDVDSRAGADHDLLLVAPLVLAVSGLTLAVLLRSLVAPVLLLTINCLSSLAALGAGAWVGRTFFGFEALDKPVPLLAFLFLVALGIDYTIFLVHRARSEARDHGTRDGMVRAVAATGGVITSAGIVLAAVFAALGVLPLVTLGQLGLIVGLGVLIDTFVVRTIVVPAVFAVLGDRIWWPGGAPRLSRQPHPAQ
ncbi:MMPL family transporter [Arsenicicoccus piscis]|uniref:Membrane protein n=1 Tax=Arsenicicoccus piscis TaxID=673954 RepID=A0ABQ6HUX1_9MICO|nr:MMPL family transporter [Arsenicicoccus piscis]MCH8627342.1 MMPL family transporter [Arsenicicoccus piscis]GMA21488.1 membrane protein [Arsenicicoccus piscis]